MRRQHAPTLAGLRVGLSGAIPAREELEKYGWNELDIRTAVVYVVEAVLRRGGEIVHGNHPTYTPLIQAVARQELGRNGRAGRKQVRMFVVSPYLQDVEVAQLCAEHSDYADIELVGPWDREELDERERDASRKEWLRTMRERMSAYADVLVCIGGKGVRPNVPTPGVLAEAALMLEQGKPLFFAAALGGFAQSVSEQLSPLAAQGNGLSREENKRLASAGDPSDLTELIVQGLERLCPAASPSPEAAAPQPTGNKDSHLQMIQGVINRMGQNSFSLKGWAVTVVAGLFALAATDSRPKVILLAFPSLLAFWLLDAYYLRQERLFRKLYDQVRRTLSPGTDYSMDTSPFQVGFSECFWSLTERVFYLPLLALALLLFAVLTFLS